MPFWKKQDMVRFDFFLNFFCMLLLNNIRSIKVKPDIKSMQLGFDFYANERVEQIRTC